jgi:hypothetical protein
MGEVEVDPGHPGPAPVTTAVTPAATPMATDHTESKQPPAAAARLRGLPALASLKLGRLTVRLPPPTPPSPPPPLSDALSATMDPAGGSGGRGSGGSGGEGGGGVSGGVSSYGLCAEVSSVLVKFERLELNDRAVLTMRWAQFELAATGAAAAAAEARGALGCGPFMTSVVLPLPPPPQQQQTLQPAPKAAVEEAGSYVHIHFSWHHKLSNPPYEST